jgi:Tfp pilus assembly protein PilN
MLEILPSNLRSFDLEDFFPIVETFGEALAWRGPELHVSNSGYSLFQKGGAGVILDDIPVPTNCDAEADVSTILSGVKTFALSFDSTFALISSFEIPRTTKVLTDKILALQRSQSVPAGSTDYFHGWFDQQPDKVATMRQVIDVILRRDIITQILTTSRLAGAKCELIFVRHGLNTTLPVAWNEAGQPYKSAEIKRWFKRMNIGLSCFGLGAMALALALFYHQGITSESLNNQIALLQPKAAALVKHQKAQEALQLQLKVLAAAASPAQLITQHMEDLAKTFDDDVVLTSLTFDHDTMTIEGLSLAPEQLIDVLSKRSGFHDVAFVAPVFRNPGELKSRFSVRLKLAGEKP